MSFTEWAAAAWRQWRRERGACWGLFRAAAARSCIQPLFAPSFSPSLAGAETRTSEGLSVLLVGLGDDGTAVIDDVITTAEGVVIPTGKASATLLKKGIYLIQSECSVFGTSRTTGRKSLGSLAWLGLGNEEANFAAENRGRGKLVTTKPTSKASSTALIHTVAGTVL